MVIAIATVAVNLPTGPSRGWELEGRETVEVSGEGGDWVAAMAACVLPDGGLVLHWMRE